ncbi:MAG: hypothetical protein JWR24_1548 [Actinoallomurus sp.]|nr:hypothetical protein [Actinoallomurus sp.]
MSTWRTHLLTQAHDFETFDCGKPPLNAWLAELLASHPRT